MSSILPLSCQSLFRKSSVSLRSARFLLNCALQAAAARNHLLQNHGAVPAVMPNLLQHLSALRNAQVRSRIFLLPFSALRLCFSALLHRLPLDEPRAPPVVPCCPQSAAPGLYDLSPAVAVAGRSLAATTRHQEGRSRLRSAAAQIRELTDVSPPQPVPISAR